MTTYVEYYSKNLTNKTSIVPKLANSLFTSALFVATNATNNFATCSLVLPRGGSSVPTVVLTGGFCKRNLAVKIAMVLISVTRYVTLLVFQNNSWLHATSTNFLRRQPASHVFLSSTIQILIGTRFLKLQIIPAHFNIQYIHRSQFLFSTIWIVLYQ